MKANPTIFLLSIYTTQLILQSGDLCDHYNIVYTSYDFIHLVIYHTMQYTNIIFANVWCHSLVHISLYTNCSILPKHKHTCTCTCTSCLDHYN